MVNGLTIPHLDPCANRSSAKVRLDRDVSDTDGNPPNLVNDVLILLPLSDWQWPYGSALLYVVTADARYVAEQMIGWSRHGLSRCWKVSAECPIL